MSWTEKIPPQEITEKITNATVDFAKRFGEYLAKEDTIIVNGKSKEIKKMNTNQLRRFFGAVKRQQLSGYNATAFILLKPKLAYAVGRDKKKSKIGDFFYVMSNAIDLVKNEQQFENFISFFEAIVAYHKAYEAELEEN